jgi:hypothetical protein
VVGWFHVGRLIKLAGKVNRINFILIFQGRDRGHRGGSSARVRAASMWALLAIIWGTDLSHLVDQVVG